MRRSLITVLLIFPLTVFCQNLWKIKENGTAVLQLKELKETLSQGAVSTFDLPLPDGGYVTFDFSNASILSESLRAKYPNITCLEGISTLDKSTRATLTLYQDSLYAMIRFKDKIVTIEPVVENIYDVSWNKQVTLNQHSCKTHGVLDVIDISNARISKLTNTFQIKNYTIAIATTGEYAQYHGGTVESTLAAIVTTLNRVNSIYKVELGVNLILSDDTDKLIYTSSGTDPFQNNDAGAILDVVVDVINNEIGEDSYDIGHVFSTGAGGLADLGAVCKSYKASGVTGTANPIGDLYDVDFVAHEIGHQFGASHTFNGIDGSCGGNLSNTSYEPGSGTTIMAYAGICGNDNVQQSSDPYFHIKSIEQIRTYIDFGSGSTCGFYSAAENSHPEILESTGSHTLPISTPFVLDGKAKDVDGDALTYNWEQVDQGSSQSLGTASGNSPLFRSFTPSDKTIRYLPLFQDVLDNQSYADEILPFYERNLKFSFNVRDQEGGIVSSVTNLSVDGSSGPFLLNSPNGGESFTINQSIDVTWDVANTDNGNVNCQFVTIILATDGETFADTLLEKTLNDGAESVVLPATISDQCRIMVSAEDNIFYDISNSDFEISAPVYSYFYPLVSFSKDYLCGNDVLNMSVGADNYSGFDDLITYQITVNSPEIELVNPTGEFHSSEMIEVVLSSTSITENKYVEIEIILESDTIQHTVIDSILVYASTIPQVATLVSPQNLSTGLGLSLLFDWDENESFLNYQLQVWDSDDNQVFISDTIIEKQAFVSGLIKSSNYSWAVQSISGCGVASSQSSTFRTGGDTCKTTYSGDLPLSLPNNQEMFYDTIHIPSEGLITSVSVVDLIGDHDWVSDLEVSLLHPNESSYVLFSNTCSNGSSEDFDLNIVNDPLLSIAPCPPIGGGNYRPINIFDSMLDESMFGDWVLVIEDFFPNSDGGQLNSWGLEICVSEGSLITNIDETLDIKHYIFPNPTSGILHVQDYVGSVKILDVLGNEILYFETQDNINVSSLEAGAYFVRLENGIVDKFHKQ